MTKLVLSCSGGGIKGVASITFLQLFEKYLMEKTGKNIYDTFDMFSGTSVGGLIVSMISVLKLNCEQASEVFSIDNVRTMMSRSTIDIITGGMLNKPKYNGKGKTKVLKNIVKKYAKEKSVLIDSSEKPLILSAYNIVHRRSKMFKSFKAEEVDLVSAMDATSAAPIYFPPVEVLGKFPGIVSNSMYCIDGGVVCNNPAMVGYVEAVKQWPKEEVKVLSIGTGVVSKPIDGEQAKGYGMLKWFKHGFLELMSEDSIVDYQSKEILGERYAKINSDLPVDVSHALDNTTQENYDGLKRVGEKWFEEYKDLALELIVGKVKKADSK